MSAAVRFSGGLANAEKEIVKKEIAEKETVPALGYPEFDLREDGNSCGRDPARRLSLRSSRLSRSD